MFGLGMGSMGGVRGRGLTLGPEVLTNGDFAGGATGWTVTGEDGTHIATFAAGTMRYQSDTTSPVLSVSQTAVTSGKTYRCVVVVSARPGAGTISVTVGGVALSLISVGTFSATMLAANTLVEFKRTAANVDITIDSISVREVL
jgi:hypothetical protein